MTHEWSHLKTNVTLDVKKTRMDVTRLILGISDRFGLEAFHFANEPFNSNNFCAFLCKIKRRRGEHVNIFCDRATYHWSDKTQNKMTSLKMRLILNVG
jgi:hypothetical protein